MGTKNKEIFFNNVVINCKNDDVFLPSFTDVLRSISKLPINDRVVDFGGSKSVCSVVFRCGYWMITIQNLKDDELPFVANAVDGNNEKRLEVPAGMALSFRNVFVYRKDDNLIRHIKVYGCPQIGKLRACINRIIKNNPDYADLNIDFRVITNSNIATILRNAKKITSAKFTSADYYGEGISEKDENAFRDYISGRGVRKTTILKGIRGENLKGILFDVIDSLIGNVDILNFVNVSMEIDGKSMNLGKYLKTEDVEVDYLSDDKTIDFDSMSRKMSEATIEVG